MAHDPSDEDLRAYAACGAKYKGGCSCERNRTAPCPAALALAKGIDLSPGAAIRMADKRFGPVPDDSPPPPEPEPAPGGGGDGGEPPRDPPEGAPEAGEPRKPRRPRAALGDLDAPAPLRFGLTPEERLGLEENDADNAARLFAVIGEKVLFVQGKGWAVVRGGRYDFRSGDLHAFEMASRLRSIVEAEARAAFGKEPTEEEGLRRLGEELRKQKLAFGDVEGAKRAIKVEAFAKLMKHATRCGNNAFVERALVALRHHVAAEIEDLDADPAVLVVPNGLIDLEAVAATEFPEPAAFADEAEHAAEVLRLRRAWLKPHDLASRPTKSAGPAYDAAADCPEWKAFVNLIMPDPAAQAALQRALGMLVYGKNDAQVALLLRGPGGNGKSTLVETLRKVLGDYAQPVKIEMFITTQNESPGRPTPEEVDLPGARAMIASEPDPTDELSSKKIKAMTGGDVRPARGLGMPQFLYRPQGVPILSFNRTPRIKGEDEGTRRRLYFIPFEVNLRELPTQHQMTPREAEWRLNSELPGILNWLLDGFRAFRELGLAPPEEWRSLKEDLLSDSDPVGGFLDNCCAKRTGGRIGTQELFEAYRKWCERTGAQEYAPRTFVRVMTEKRFTRIKTAGGRMHWSGLEWLDDPDVRSLLSGGDMGERSENPAPPDDEPPPF